ncbi:hypothetical protein A3L08_03790 [Thermococcus pacificus]|uniref:DUF2240 domain-containing protein n=2 Tax=Thermococcus pacificus TaxID=71998 RepID=A0A218P6X6_9EURY|nr:DUF2240 family protein [Thermococcus pacificus]ASJ06510.1 hypothetical protein A3L08_03790 [Thermococcus pacificus]
MHPLKRAVDYKGSTEFTKSELVGILSFSLRIMGVKEAKEFIAEAVKSGLLTERDGKLVVNEAALDEERKGGDLFEEMVEHIASSLGWERADVIDGINGMRERYGDLDKKVLAYLFGMDKGVDMARFRERLEL